MWASDPETGETALKQVTQTFVNQTDHLVHISVGKTQITATTEHPFYIPEKEWTEAAKLCAGDILVLVNGDYVVVEFVQHEILENPIEVYNFEVEDFHTYFVGKSSVLVHNTCHGNSLKTKKKTDLYVLRDNDTNVVKKIGETTRGVKRYTKKFYRKNNVYMQIINSGSKKTMYYQQHRMLKAYVSHANRLPKMNLSLW